MIGLAAAHWSFQFVVLMPFRHEIGSPEWRMNPKWLEDEEKQWEEDEEEMRLCGWRGRGRGKKGVHHDARSRSSVGDGAKKPRVRQVCEVIRVAVTHELAFDCSQVQPRRLF